MDVKKLEIEKPLKATGELMVVMPRPSIFTHREYAYMLEAVTETWKQNRDLGLMQMEVVEIMRKLVKIVGK